MKFEPVSIQTLVIDNMEHPWAEPSVINHCRLLMDSYTKWTKKSLLKDSFASDVEVSFMLYHASFVLVSHGIENDPIFNYANLEAQKLWGITWDEFTCLPSKFSVEPMEVGERQKLLDAAEKNGYVDNYEGIRRKKSGEKFRISNTTLWNTVDKLGGFKGQAAMFDKWTNL